MRRFWATVLTTAIASTTVLAVTQAPAAAVSFSVTTTDDTNDGSCDVGHCSLREAVIAANANPGDDAILLPAGTYTLTRTGADDTAANGDLDVTGPLTIAKIGPGTVIIQAGTDATNGIDKVFSVNPVGSLAGFAVSMSDLTIRHGRNTQSFASFNGFGGCMDFDAGVSTGSGSLTLTNVVIDHCTTTNADGGGLAVFFSKGGTLTIDGSTISNNNATRTPTGSLGGGLFIGCGGGTTTIDITNSTISGNTTSGKGGGVYAFGTCGSSTLDYEMQHVTISNNTAVSDGGGLSTSAFWTIGDTGGASVISGNSGASGGGIHSSTSVTTLGITGAIITGNSATSGSGGGISAAAATGNSVTGSIITGNSSTTGSDGIHLSSGSLDATNNWWGCSAGPSDAACDHVSTGVDADPWLQVRTSVSNTNPAAGSSLTATASVNTNSDGANVTSQAAVLHGRTVSWSASNATVGLADATIGNSGTATANLTAATGTGPGSVTAIVDNDDADSFNTATFNRAANSTTTVITGHSPDPSDQGLAITVTYEVQESSALTPTGSVVVSDGVDSCIGTVAAGQCDMVLTTAGARQLQAQYLGDVSFAGSTSAAVTHTVNSDAPGPIYLVTNAPGGVLYAGDIAIKARLDATGRTVVIVDDDAVDTTDMTDGSLIALSSGVVFSKVGNQLANIPVPMITWEAYLFDDNGLATVGSETPTTFNRIRITRPGHPLAAGKSNSPVVMTTANRLSYATVPTTATVVATVPGFATRATIFAYEIGDTLASGSPAPSCRVGLFPDYAGTNKLSGNGRDLFDAAIDWSLNSCLT